MFRNLAFALFPNSKEQSESVSALFAFRKYVQTERSRVGVIVVADGSTPRTGFLLALERPKWVISVDPIMRAEWIDSEKLPSNLCVCKCKIEEVELDELNWREIDSVVIIAVHAHVGFENYLDVVLQRKQKTTIIAIPCCIPLEIAPKQATDWKLNLLSRQQDYSILSPCRTVAVWQN